MILTLFFWSNCFCTWPKSQDKNLNILRIKELISWNKKHFSSFLKDFHFQFTWNWAFKKKMFHKMHPHDRQSSSLWLSDFFDLWTLLQIFSWVHVMNSKYLHIFVCSNVSIYFKAWIKYRSSHQRCSIKKCSQLWGLQLHWKRDSNIGVFL